MYQILNAWGAKLPTWGHRREDTTNISTWESLKNKLENKKPTVCVIKMYKDHSKLQGKKFRDLCKNLHTHSVSNNLPCN